MKVLLTGPDGQAGRALRKFVPAWADLACVDIDDLDIRDTESVLRRIEDFRPDTVINAAAYTDVEGAETDLDEAYAVNAIGTENLAAAVKVVQGRLVHISTDYVFDGISTRPMSPDDVTNPLNVYGKSKLAGEESVRALLHDDAIIIRTSWLYYEGGHNFVRTMLRLMAHKEAVRVVADQVGAPTWAGSLAEAIWALVATKVAGVYHWRDAGVASWYDFAIAIAEIGLDTGLLDHEVEIIPVSSDEYPTKAQRPAYSLLSTEKLENDIGIQPSHWRKNLRVMLEKLGNA